MKILIVTHYFKPHIGGIEIVAYNQAKELVKKGHEVTILTSKLNHEKDVEEHDGIRIVRVSAWNFFEKKFDVPYPVFSPRLISAINREVKKNDIIHAHGILYLGSFTSSLFAKIYKKPFFVTEHVGFVSYKSSIISAVEQLALHTVGLVTLRASDAAIVLNLSVGKWIKRYKEEVYNLPNGVDLTLFNKPTEQEKLAIRKQYNISVDDFVVLFVGRFVAKKGFDILYKAKDPSYLLVFVGGGSIPEYIKSDNSAKIIGSLPQEDLALMYKASDAFILPSHGEGFPLSIQEAMATGLPIVTSKDNNLDHILDSPFISYIDITETAIKLAIKKIQSDSVLRENMGEYSTKIAQENFSWEKNSTKLLGLYQSKVQLKDRSKPKLVYVTTSWDDGHKLDLRLAALLKKYGIRGTFYVCPQDREFKNEELLSPQDLLSISKDFEIGGHTITHPHLTKIPVSQADAEITQSKSYLEELLQQEVTAFCYPYGDYDDKVKDLVEKNGYKLARTTKRYAFDLPRDVFELPTTFHTYAHYSDLHKIFYFSDFSPITLKKYWDWEKLAIALFEHTCQNGGVFHLWGHSWEVEKNNGWHKLENVLSHIAKKSGVMHQTNTEILSNYSGEGHALTLHRELAK